MNTTRTRKKLITATRGAAVAAAGTVLAATFLAVAACESGSQKTGASTATSSVASSTSAATSTKAPQGQDDQVALQMLDAIVRGDYAAATTHFDSQMKEKLTPQALGAAWSGYQEEFGSYQSHGDPQDVTRGDLTVVNIPLQMTRMPGQFRVTFRNDGTVAGLFFLRTGVPVP